MSDATIALHKRGAGVAPRWIILCESTIVNDYFLWMSLRINNDNENFRVHYLCLEDGESPQLQFYKLVSSLDIFSTYLIVDWRTYTYPTIE